MIAPLQTRRLLLRPLTLADAEQVQRIFPVWGVVEFLNSRVPWPYPADGVYTHYRDQVLPGMERGEEWHWTLRPKHDPDRIVGVVALFAGETNNRGFWLGVPWQRQGLMTEAAEAVTNFWFDVLGQKVMRVPKAVSNTGSRRISERSGMRVIATGEGDYVSGKLPTETWEITAEEWRRRRVRVHGDF